VSLYTKVLVDHAIHVIEKIKNTEVAELVGICLKSTYFSYKGNIYEQIHGIAIGSLLSPVVANIYMEQFEGL
jgi:retron-type reverse transcriptase